MRSESEPSSRQYPWCYWNSGSGWHGVSSWRRTSLQETFQEMKKDAKVDIGFNFTKEASMDHIQRDGLMTKSDRVANPKLSRTSCYVLMAHFLWWCVRGKQMCIQEMWRCWDYSSSSSRQCAANWTRWSPYHGAPTLVQALVAGFDTNNDEAHRTPQIPALDEVVLLWSSQCIPLIRFPVPMASHGRKWCRR